MSGARDRSDLDLLCEAATIAAGQPYLSQGEIRWRLRVGAVRARRLHQALEDAGIVEPVQMFGERGRWCPRETLITETELPAKLAQLRGSPVGQGGAR